MLSYIHFLLKTFSKRISSYILVAIHLVVIFIFLVTNIDNFTGNAKGISYLSSINTFMKFFPFLFASAFSVLVVTHNFKESVNGLEIMIVSKPITRKQIIVSKFLVVFTLLLFHQVFIFIFYLLFSSYDSVSSSTIRANWAISLALGGFIVQSIFVFIIVLIASVVGKLGTAIISILIATIIPIASLIIAPLSKGAVSMHELTTKRQTSYADNSHDIELDNSLRYVYSLKIDPTKVINDNAGLSLSTSYDYDFEKDLYRNHKKYYLWHNYQKNKWYQDVYPFDIWYHWGRFMNLFTKDVISAKDVRIEGSQNFIQNLDIRDLVKLNSDDAFLEIGQKNNLNYPLLKYGLFLILDKFSNKKMTENQFQESLRDYLKKMMKPDLEIETVQDLVTNIKKLFNTDGQIDIQEFNVKSLVDRIKVIRYYVRSLKDPSKLYGHREFEYRLVNILAVIVYKILSKEKSLVTTSEGDSLRIDNSKVQITHYPPISKDGPKYKELTDEQKYKYLLKIKLERLRLLKNQLRNFGLIQIYDKDDKRNFLGYTVSSTPYASTGLVAVAWLLIGILLGSISIAIFFKKDFK